MRLKAHALDKQATTREELFTVSTTETATYSIEQDGPYKLTVRLHTCFADEFTSLPIYKRPLSKVVKSCSPSTRRQFISVELKKPFDDCEEMVRTAIDEMVSDLVRRRQPQPYTPSYSLQRNDKTHTYMLFLQQQPDEQLLAALRADPALVVPNLEFDEMEGKLTFGYRHAFSHFEISERVGLYANAFLLRCMNAA